VNPALGVRDVAGLIALGRSRSRPLVFASSGNGTSLHLIGELFRLQAGLDMTHAPYRGSAPAVNDLLAGNVDCMFDQLPASIGQIRAGALLALATTGPRRNPALPGVPALAETLPGVVAQSWNAVAVPAGTPPALLARISEDIRAALADPVVQAKVAPFGADYAGSTPAAMQALLAAELARWGPVIRGAGITAT
jgi:tripartite-type tricarboxylate transporter receptor subunit TctC